METAEYADEDAGGAAELDSHSRRGADWRIPSVCFTSEDSECQVAPVAAFA